MILATDAITMLCAFQSCVETFAILFLAFGFLAIAFSFRHEGFYSLESPGFSEVSHLLSEMDFVLVSYTVLTGYADTVRPANFSSCKTLAIQFKTAYLGTFASVY